MMGSDEQQVSPKKEDYGISTGLENLRLKTPTPQSSADAKLHDELSQRPTDPLQSVEFSSQRVVESLRSNASRVVVGSQNEVFGNQGVIRSQMTGSSSELQHDEEELGLLRAAVQMLSDGQHPAEFYIEQLNEQAEAKRRKLDELRAEWDAIAKPLQERKGELELSLSTIYPEASGKLSRKKEIELETQSVLAEVKRREEELSKLSSDLEKQPKLAPRRTHVERIKEITKNSRKQDADIQRILKDTRDLQLESNTIQERLNRTYAVVDETIFREAKKDPVARQAYRLLTKVHESFEQIAEKILATDRIRRDAADYEAKLAIVGARSFNMGKLQADIDAIRKENDHLEQRLHNL